MCRECMRHSWRRTTIWENLFSKVSRLGVIEWQEWLMIWMHYFWAPVRDPGIQACDFQKALTKVQALQNLSERSLSSLKKGTEERTRWRRRRWTWSISLYMDTSGIHLQTRKCIRITSWEQAGVPDKQKRIHRTTQNSVGWRNYREKIGVLVRTGPALSRWGNWSRRPIPISG